MGDGGRGWEMDGGGGGGGGRGREGEGKRRREEVGEEALVGAVS